MASKKKILMENPKWLQFVDQDFPVVEETLGDQKFPYIKVISFVGKKPAFLCSYFKVMVVKDCDGFITYIVEGEGKSIEGSKRDSDVWIMRTDDFNQAYGLKNKLDDMLGKSVPNERQKMPCYGSLQREKTWLD
jgi:hypothetical protein